ncbi:MAG: hypothetical protein IPG86_19860 [Chitinophagaceae bacterium]|nr:hypothetical protein [Chitinophagaceae bacterium]
MGEGLSAERMVTADRDRVLAAIYIDTFGSRVNGKTKCLECQQPFEIEFQLPELQQHLESSAAGTVEESGIYCLDECEFRLPTGEDELAIAGLQATEAVNALLQLCVVSGGKQQGEKIQEAMSGIAPVIQTEIKTVCPECGHTQQARFDIQSYLLSKLKEEQKQVYRDIHRLASSYKWSHREILELPRRLRRSYVKMIEDELTG